MSDPATLPSSGIGRVVELLAFLCELAMLALLAVAGAGLPDGTWARVVLAVALPVVAIAVWSRWMAPTSTERLADPPRLIVQIVLFLLTGALLTMAGHPVWGVAFAVAATAVFAATRRFDGVTGAEG
jgi:hypothetical protein